MSTNDDNRPRGILTPTDREFLQGEKEYANEETASHRRGDIRDRVINSLKDFRLLVEDLDEGERRAILKKVQAVIQDETESYEALEYMTAFQLLILEADTVEEKDPAPFEIRHNFTNLEQPIQRGTLRALFELGFIPVEVSVDVSAPGYYTEQIEELVQSVHDGDGAVGRQEIDALIAAGEIDTERLTEFVRGEIDPEAE